MAEANGHVEVVRILADADECFHAVMKKDGAFLEEIPKSLESGPAVWSLEVDPKAPLGFRFRCLGLGSGSQELVLKSCCPWIDPDVVLCTVRWQQAALQRIRLLSYVQDQSNGPNHARVVQ